MATIANGLTLAMLSLEAADYFRARAVDSLLPLNDRTVVNGTLLSLTLIWVLYAAGVLAVGLARRLELVRLGGLALLAVVVVKLLLVDTLEVEPDLRSFTVVLNPHFLTFVTVLVVLAAVAYLYRRAQSHLSEWEEQVFKYLLVAVNLVALWALSHEIITYFESREALLSVDQLNGTLLFLTLIWALYAAGMLAVGLARRLELVRLGRAGAAGRGRGQAAAGGHLRGRAGSPFLHRRPQSPLPDVCHCAGGPGRRRVPVPPRSIAAVRAGGARL